MTNMTINLCLSRLVQVASAGSPQRQRFCSLKVAVSSQHMSHPSQQDSKVTKLLNMLKVRREVNLLEGNIIQTRCLGPKISTTLRVCLLSIMLVYSLCLTQMWCKDCLGLHACHIHATSLQLPKK